MSFRKIRGMCLSLPLAAAMSHALPAAADYPERPITLVVPWTVGGSADVLARLVAKQMAETIKQSIVVENRPGAAGTVGSCFVSRAAPDGYTLIFNTNSTYGIAPHLYKSIACDPQNELAPIGLAATNQQVLAVNPALGVKDMASFIALLKREPGKVAFASSGIGGTSHLAMEQFLSMSGTSMLHVPYKGGSDALQALLGNQVQAAFVDASSAIPVARAGRIVPLGTSGGTPVAGLENIRPIRDAGLPGFDSYTAFALFAPRKTPESVIGAINGAMNQALDSSELRAVLKANAYDVGGGSAQDLGDMVRSESARWETLIRSRGIKVD